MADSGWLTAVRRPWSTDVRRRLVLAVLTAGLLLVLGWLILPTLVTSQDTRDARDVFCLRADERGALADAATALGVAREGSTEDAFLVKDGEDGTVSAFEWRERYPDDFARTCDALATVDGKVAAEGGGGAVDGVVLPLLILVLTSALTFAATRRQNQTARGQADAGELRTAVAVYTSAANRFLDSRVSLPADWPTTEMDAARDVLVGRLNGVVERESAWLAVREIVASLRDGDLGTALAATLRDLPNPARVKRIEDMRARVRDVSDIGFLVADALAENDGADRRLTQPLVAAGTRP